MYARCLETGEVYSHLKEEALDRIKWRNHFRRGFGPSSDRLLMMMLYRLGLVSVVIKFIFRSPVVFSLERILMLTLQPVTEVRAIHLCPSVLAHLVRKGT
jgi:hypothetical protein